MTPGMIVVSNLETVKTGEIDVGRQLRAAVEISQSSSADKPNGHIVARRERFERTSGVRTQLWSGWIDVE